MNTMTFFFFVHFSLWYFNVTPWWFWRWERALYTNIQVSICYCWF